MAKNTGLASISEGRSDILRVDPRKLHVKKDWNCRDLNDIENKQHIEMLTASIIECGVTEPLTVYWEDNKAFVADGHCRLLATMHAINEHGVDIKTVPVKSELRYANEADRLFGQQLRNAGKPFSVLEQAKLFKRLLDLGWQQNDIAKKAGMSAARVSQILEYNLFPEGVKTMVQKGEVAPSTAMAIVKEHGNGAEAALQQGLETAKAAGKSKVQAKHVEGGTVEPKVNVKTAVKDCFEYADIDDSSDDIVVVKFPAEQFEIIRKVLGL